MIFGTKTSCKTWQSGFFWKRVTAAFVIMVFTLFDAARYAPPGYANPIAVAASPIAAPFSIPPELGKIDEVFFSDRMADGGWRMENDAKSCSSLSAIRHPLPAKTIVFVQDAHDSLEAQENIAKIIHLLVKEKGIRTVFEEGYEGPVPTDKFFDFIKDPAVKQKVSYFLLDKLRIGGAEYAHINREKLEGGGRMEEGGKPVLRHPPSAILHPDLDWQLIGVDDLKLYRENIRHYQDASKHTKDTEEDLARLFAQVTTLADQCFPKGLKNFLKRQERFHEKKLPLLDYLKDLRKIYLEASNFTPSPSPLPPEWGEDIRQRTDPSNALWRKGEGTRFSFEYPALSILLEAGASGDRKLLGEVNRLDSSVIFKEMEKLETKISGGFLRSDRDRKIFGYYRGLKLLQRLNRIELTPAEFEALKERRADGDLKQDGGRRMEEDVKLGSSLSVIRHPSSGFWDTQGMVEFVAAQTHKSLVLSKEWEQHIQDPVRFYEAAHSRDGALAKALEQHFIGNRVQGIGDSQKQNLKNLNPTPYPLNPHAAILVYGGFHAGKIKEMLREKDFSYVVVSPKFNPDDKRHQAYYKQLMSIGRHSFETPLNVAKAARAESGFVRALTLGEGAFRSELRAIASLAGDLSNDLDPATLNMMIEQRLSASGPAPAPSVRSEVRAAHDPKDLLEGALTSASKGTEPRLSEKKREAYAETLKRSNPDLRTKKEDENPGRDNYTDPLRHIDLLKLLLRIKPQLPFKPQVLVLGPGMTKTKMGENYSPQMIETVAMLNGLHAEYAVIDRSREILKAAQYGSIYEYSPRSDKHRYWMAHPELKDMIMAALASVVQGVPVGGMDRLGRYRVNFANQSIATFRGEFEEIEYGDHLADLVIGVLSIYHALKHIPFYEEKQEFLYKLIRVLKPGCSLLMRKEELLPFYRQAALDNISVWTPKESLRQIAVILKQMERRSRLAGDLIELSPVLQGGILQIVKTNPGSKADEKTKQGTGIASKDQKDDSFHRSEVRKGLTEKDFLKEAAAAGRAAARLRKRTGDEVLAIAGNLRFVPVKKGEAEAEAEGFRRYLGERAIKAKDFWERKFSERFSQEWHFSRMLNALESGKQSFQAGTVLSSGEKARVLVIPAYDAVALQDYYFYILKVRIKDRRERFVAYGIQSYADGDPIPYLVFDLLPEFRGAGRKFSVSELYKIYWGAAAKRTARDAKGPVREFKIPNLQFFTPLAGGDPAGTLVMFLGLGLAVPAGVKIPKPVTWRDSRFQGGLSLNAPEYMNWLIYKNLSTGSFMDDRNLLSPFAESLKPIRAFTLSLPDVRSEMRKEQAFTGPLEQGQFSGFTYNPSERILRTPEGLEIPEVLHLGTQNIVFHTDEGRWRGIYFRLPEDAAAHYFREHVPQNFKAGAKAGVVPPSAVIRISGKDFLVVRAVDPVPHTKSLQGLLQKREALEERYVQAVLDLFSRIVRSRLYLFDPRPENIVVGYLDGRFGAWLVDADRLRLYQSHSRLLLRIAVTFLKNLGAWLLNADWLGRNSRWSFKGIAGAFSDDLALWAWGLLRDDDRSPKAIAAALLGNMSFFNNEWSVNKAFQERVASLLRNWGSGHETVQPVAVVPAPNDLVRLRQKPDASVRSESRRAEMRTDEDLQAEIGKWDKYRNFARARAQQMLRYNREAIQLLTDRDMVKILPGEEFQEQSDAILEKVREYADRLKAFADKLHSESGEASEDEAFYAEIDKLAAQGSQEQAGKALKKRSNELRVKIDEIRAQFPALHAAHDKETLDKLNLRIVVYYKARIKTQLLQARAYFSQKDLPQNVVLTMLAALSLNYMKLSREYFWRWQRGVEEAATRKMQVVSREGRLRRVYDYGSFRIKQAASEPGKEEAPVTIEQDRWVRRTLEDGSFTYVPEKTKINLKNLETAYRSQVHTMISQEEDFARILSQAGDLDYWVDLLKTSGEILTSYDQRQMEENLKQLLNDKPGGLKQGRVHQKAAAAADIETALAKLEAKDSKSALEFLEAAGEALEGRFKDIEDKKKGVESRKDSLAHKVRLEETRRAADELQMLAGEKRFAEGQQLLGLLYKTHYLHIIPGAKQYSSLQQHISRLKGNFRRLASRVRPVEGEKERILNRIREDLEHVQNMTGRRSEAREKKADDEAAEAKIRFEIPQSAVIAEHPILGKVADAKLLDPKQFGKLAKELHTLESACFPMKKAKRESEKNVLAWKRHLKDPHKYVYALIDPSGDVAGVSHGRFLPSGNGVSLDQFMSLDDGVLGKGAFLLDSFLSQMYRKRIMKISWEFIPASKRFYNDNEKGFLNPRKKAGILRAVPETGDLYKIVLLKDPLDPQFGHLRAFLGTRRFGRSSFSVTRGEAARAEVRFEIPQSAVIAEHSVLGKVADAKLLDPKRFTKLAKEIYELERVCFPGEKVKDKFKASVFKTGIRIWKENLEDPDQNVFVLINPYGNVTGAARGSSFLPAERTAWLDQLMSLDDGTRGKGTFLLDSFLSQMYREGVRKFWWDSAIAKEFYNNDYKGFLDLREKNGILKQELHTGRKIKFLHEVDLFKDPLDPKFKPLRAFWGTRRYEMPFDFTQNKRGTGDEGGEAFDPSKVPTEPRRRFEVRDGNLPGPVAAILDFTIPSGSFQKITIPEGREARLNKGLVLKVNRGILGQATITPISRFVNSHHYQQILSIGQEMEVPHNGGKFLLRVIEINPAGSVTLWVRYEVKNAALKDTPAPSSRPEKVPLQQNISRVEKADWRFKGRILLAGFSLQKRKILAHFLLNHGYSIAEARTVDAAVKNVTEGETSGNAIEALVVPWVFESGSNGTVKGRDLAEAVLAVKKMPVGWILKKDAIPPAGYGGFLNRWKPEGVAVLRLDRSGADTLTGFTDDELLQLVATLDSLNLCPATPPEPRPGAQFSPRTESAGTVRVEKEEPQIYAAASAARLSTGEARLASFSEAAQRQPKENETAEALSAGKLFQILRRALAAGGNAVHFDIRQGEYFEKTKTVNKNRADPDNTRFLNPKFFRKMKAAGVPEASQDLHLLYWEPSHDLIKALAGTGMLRSIDVQQNAFRSPDLLTETLKVIRSTGLKAGLVVESKETVAQIPEDALAQSDIVMFTAVDTSQVGGITQLEVLKKARELRERGFKGLIADQGGINAGNIALAKSYGADIFVVGMDILANKEGLSPAQAIRKLRAAAEIQPAAQQIERSKPSSVTRAEMRTATGTESARHKRVVDRDVVGEWSLPGVAVEQEHFDRVAVMPEDYHLVLHVNINGTEYSVGHGDYLVLTLPSGKKVYWGGQHNLSYAFFFEHFGDEAKGRLGSVLWRHAGQHQDLNIGSLSPAGPPQNATPQEQIEFGLQTLNAANYRGYIENRKMARVEHATTTEELDAWDQGPEKGGVLDIDLDILIHPETAKPQAGKIFSEKLAKAAASAEAIFITNSSELQAVYPFGRSRPGFPLYINPNDAVSFGMELIREIVKQDVSRSEVRDQNVDGQARLVPAVFDLAERVPKKFWDRPIAIDLIADNTGTLTPHQEQAQPEDIRERVMKLLSHDGNRLIVNTGDDAHLVAESHRPLIEYLTGIGAQNRWFLTSAGGTVVSSLKENGELKNQAIAAPWSVALKTRLSKALVNAFYNEALARVQTGEIDIWGLSPFRISTSRTQVLYDIGRKKKNWETIPAGENKNIITYLLPDFLGRQAYIYDSGAKMAIGTTTSAAVYPWLDLGFFEAVAKAAKKFAGRVNDRIEFIPSMNFLDLSARTKLDGAQAILHQNPVSHEHQLVLTASIGDGLNDLPALNHSFAKAEAPEVGLSVALSHHEAFASRAADHVFISNLEKMDGAAEVLAWLNTIQGKTVRQLIAERRAQLHLQTWQRSEARFKKLEAQLEVLADPSRSLLTRGQVEEILGLVRSGALKLFGEDMDVLEMIDGKEKVVGVTDLMVVHLYGLLHRSVDVFVRLPNGKFLILRRPPGRVVPPNADLQKFNAPKFSIPGGHPSAGETYREGMEKELIEETGLPEGWKLEGELQSIGTEGEFTSPPEDLKNRERRAVYLYKASPREAELIRKRDSELTRVKQEKSKEAYKQWLHAEQVAHPGRGEAWSYHELSLAEIMEIIDGREVFLQENYGQGETETVRMIFEEDLLPFLLKDERVLQSLSMKRSELRSRKPEGGGRKAEGGKPSAIHHPPPDIRSEAVRPDLKNRAEMRSDGFGGREVKKDARELAARDAAARAENLNAEHTAVPGHIDHNAVGHLASAPDLSGGKLDVQGVRFTIIRYLHRLLSFLEPISRYQDYLAFFSLVNDRKNLITEPLVSQTPSAVTWFGPIGAGDGFLHLFRDQFPLAEPFLSMQSIFKIHKKYDILASQNVKLFNPDRSEVRSQPDRGRGKVEEGISGTVSIKTRSEMRGSQIADNRPQTKDNDQKQEPVKSKSQVSNRKSGKARSEIRTATSVLEKAVSQDRTDRMVKAIRKGVQPATVFVDAEDFPNLSTAQKNEYFYAALAGQGVRIVVYNEHGQVQDKELNALLKLDRVTRTDRDLSGAQIIFDRPNTPGIHLSKQILPSQELVQRLRKKVSFFKTHGQNGGTLAAALLWAWSGGEDAQMCEISRGRDGFWIVAESLVNALQKSYNATLAFAVAA